MRALAPALFLLLGPTTMLADGRSDLDILRARCTEQERQIRTLEEEIESLHSQLALERRRSRGVEPSAAAASPIAPARVENYTVKHGDTLSSIARRYRTSADELMKQNGIADPTRLRVGQKLNLPANATAPKPAPVAATKKPAKVASSPAPKPATKKDSRAENTYKVLRGDTLYGIARKHKMSVVALKALNPKVENKIVVGQNLTVNGKAKVSLPSLRTTKTQTISTRPSPTPKPAARKKAKPAPPTAKKAPSKPAAKPAESKPAPEPARAPKTISSILVMDEISFGNFAKQHSTTPDQLNALNGWEFKSDLVLARGSEIYVPGQ